MPHSKTKITAHLFALASALLLAGCDSATPQNYFDRAVLNCNLMHGFASRGMQGKLESPSVKLKEGTKDQTVPMTRKEIVENDINSLETAFAKVKKLRETDDTRAMLQASVALYEYVLPVYKAEYQQLARLYDENAPRDQIDSLARTIETKYHAGYAERFDHLTVAAKPYAERHNIKVKWDIRTAPAP